IGFPFQILANVIIKCSGERTLNASVTRVILGTLASGIGIGAFQAAVVAADRALLIAEQLLAKTLDRNAQVALLYVILRQAREARGLLRDPGTLSRSKPVAFHQRPGVFSA